MAILSFKMKQLFLFKVEDNPSAISAKLEMEKVKRCSRRHRKVMPIPTWRVGCNEMIKWLFIEDFMADSYIGEGNQLGTEESNRPVTTHWQTWSNNVVWVHLVWVRFELRTLVVIANDCIGSCKYNYHSITTMMAHGE